MNKRNILNWLELFLLINLFAFGIVALCIMKMWVVGVCFWTLMVLFQVRTFRLNNQLKRQDSIIEEFKKLYYDNEDKLKEQIKLVKLHQNNEKKAIKEIFELKKELEEGKKELEEVKKEHNKKKRAWSNNQKHLEKEHKKEIENIRQNHIEEISQQDYIDSIKPNESK